MKKWIVRIVLALLVIAAFAGVGFAGYRLGYRQGAQATGDGDRFLPLSRFEHGPGFGNQFERGFHREFSFGGPVMRHRGGFGFFAPFAALAKIAVLGLVVWIAYMLFKGNGWQLTLTRVAAPTTPPAAVSDSESSVTAKLKKGKQ